MDRLFPHHYSLLLHDYSTTEYAESIGQSNRNIRGIRETALKKIRNLYGGVLTYRKENSLPMTPDEKYFLEKGVRKKGNVNASRSKSAGSLTDNE